MKSKISGITTLLISCLINFSIAQNLSITGVVSDFKGPLEGVNIVIEGTDTGTITDEFGQYSLQAKVGDTLRFSYLGMASEIRIVAIETIINVFMQEELNLLEEISVVALGINKQRKTLTYQADEVTSDNLVKVVPTRAVQGLAGKVAGLQINIQDQGVNPSNQIVLRGLRSISQSNSPMIVIDGSVASQGAFDDLNPLDIESINILKGGTAGILYGSLGSNGAIIVNTKQGKLDQEFTIGLQSTTSFDNVAYMPDFQNEFGMGFNGIDYDPRENTNWGPRFDGQLRRVGPIFSDGSFQEVPYAPVKDNLKDFFETGFTLQNTLYLSGGGQNSSFYLSISDQQTSGLIPSDTYDRNTFRVNASKTLGKLTLSLNSSYLTDKTSVVGSRLGGFEEPIYSLLLFTPVNIPLTDYKDWENPNSFGYVDNYYNLYQDNPYWAIGTTRDNDRTNRLNANIQASWDIKEWLNFTARLGLNNTQGSGKDYRRRQSYDPVLQPFKVYIPPFVFESEFQTNSYSAEAILTGNVRIDDQFDLTAILGATGNETKSRISSIGFNDLSIPGFFDVSNGLGTPVITLDEFKKRIYGFFADTTIGYKDFLYLNLAGRYDFTSTLPTDENSYFYPAVGLSYVISESIPSIKEKIDYLKVALSNSTTYNDLGPYEINERFTQAQSFPYGNLAGFELSDIAIDPGISKEKINTTEFGLNSRFLDDRFSFDASLYMTKSTDLITLTSPSLASGANAYLTNIGEIETKGIELTLGGEVIKSKDWNWNVGLNFTSYESVVNEIAEGVTEVTISSIDKPFIDGLIGFYAIVGEPFPQIRASSYVRDPLGRVVINAENGNPEIGPLKNMGKTTPDFILGFTSALRWKNLNMALTMDYRTGHVYYEEGSDYMEFTGRSVASVEYDRQNFVFPNSVIEVSPGVYEENTDILTTGGDTYVFWADTMGFIKENYIKDASAFKIRELALNYALPAKILSDLKIRTMEIGFIARNLLTFLPEENRFADPEFQNQDEPSNAIGIGGLLQPPPVRSFGLTLKVEF